jgi:hypothetical protein
MVVDSEAEGEGEVVQGTGSAEEDKEGAQSRSSSMVVEAEGEGEGVQGIGRACQRAHCKEAAGAAGGHSSHGFNKIPRAHPRIRVGPGTCPPIWVGPGIIDVWDGPSDKEDSDDEDDVSPSPPWRVMAACEWASFAHRLLLRQEIRDKHYILKHKSQDVVQYSDCLLQTYGRVLQGLAKGTHPLSNVDRVELYPHRFDC